MKATAQEYEFHRRILARGDPVAFVQLTEWLYFSLVQDVQQHAGWNADPILVEEAAGQALLDYRDAPARYDPDRTSLRSYLTMAAYRDFQTAQTKEQRILAHQISLFDPALQETTGDAALMEPAEIIISQAQAEEVLQFIAEAFPDSAERRIATLILNGVRAPEPYAQILGVGNVPREEQIEAIAMVRYRIIKRLRRRVGRQLQRMEGHRS
jgi:RNA polymerase sigma-70 factor (ECF subfamily)